MNSIENRVLELEKSELKTVARMNAIERLVMNLWIETLSKKSDPVAAAKHLREALLKSCDIPQKSFHGADPAYLDALSAEYRNALDDILGMIEGFLAAVEATKGPQT